MMKTLSASYLYQSVKFCKANSSPCAVWIGAAGHQQAEQQDCSHCKNLPSKEACAVERMICTAVLLLESILTEQQLHKMCCFETELFMDLGVYHAIGSVGLDLCS